MDMHKKPPHICEHRCDIANAVVVGCAWTEIYRDVWDITAPLWHLYAAYTECLYQNAHIIQRRNRAATQTIAL